MTPTPEPASFWRHPWRWLNERLMAWQMTKLDHKPKWEGKCSRCGKYVCDYDNKDVDASTASCLSCFVVAETQRKAAERQETEDRRIVNLVKTAIRELEAEKKP